MKKYLLLLAAFGIFLFTSCSDDDDNGGETTDPIVGTWVFTETTVPGLDPNACLPNESTISLRADNTADSTFYLPEDCEAENNPGTWSKTGTNTYQLEVPLVGPQQGTVTFQNSNNTFVFVTSGVSFTFERQ